MTFLNVSIFFIKEYPCQSKGDIHHYEVQKCHPTQKALINEPCTFPELLARNCHSYERVLDLREIVILCHSTFARSRRIVLQSVSQFVNFHGAKATSALNVDRVRSQFRKRYGLLVLDTIIFLSFLQDLRDRHFVVRLYRKLLIYMKLLDLILANMRILLTAM